MITTLTLIGLGIKAAKSIAADSGMKVAAPKVTPNDYRHLQELKDSAFDWLDADNDGHILDDIGDTAVDVLSNIGDVAGDVLSFLGDLLSFF